MGTLRAPSFACGSSVGLSRSVGRSLPSSVVAPSWLPHGGSGGGDGGGGGDGCGGGGYGNGEGGGGGDGRGGGGGDSGGGGGGSSMCPHRFSCETYSSWLRPSRYASS